MSPLGGLQVFLVLEVTLRSVAPQNSITTSIVTRAPVERHNVSASGLPPDHIITIRQRKTNLTKKSSATEVFLKKNLNQYKGAFSNSIY